MIVDFRNNVVYNLSGATNLGDAHINFINNYYRPGPNTPRDKFPLAAKIGSPDKLQVFMSRQHASSGSPAFSRDNYLAITFDRWKTGGYVQTTLEKVRVHKNSTWRSRPKTDPAGVALEKVLQKAGSATPRDAADIRIVDGIRDRTNHMIDSQDEVGGWPTLKGPVTPATAKDTDGDGMPDEWELKHGLNPHDPKDGNAVQGADGYTNWKEYLNSL